MTSYKINTHSLIPFLDNNLWESGNEKMLLFIIKPKYKMTRRKYFRYTVFLLKKATKLTKESKRQYEYIYTPYVWYKASILERFHVAQN